MSGHPLDIDSSIVAKSHGDLVEIFWRFGAIFVEILEKLKALVPCYHSIRTWANIAVILSS
jgi:hypothetical protein